MKKTLLMLLAFTLFFSCQDDDNNNEDKVVGSWVGVLFEKSGCNDANEDGATNLDCTDAACTSLILQGDGDYELIVKENLVGITEFGSWSLSGSTITFSFNDDGNDISYTRDFIVQDTVLILSSTVSSTGCLESTTFNPAGS